MPIHDLDDSYIPYFPEHRSGLFESFGRGIVKQTLDIASGLVGTLEEGVELVGLAEEENYLTQVRRNINSASDEWSYNPNGSAAWVGGVVGQAVPYMAAALTGQAYLGWVGSAGLSFAVEGQQAYDEAKARGVSETDANKERLIVGSINAVIEGLQMGKLMKFADKGKHSFKEFAKLARAKAWDKLAKAGGEFTGEIAKNAVEEAAEEFLQTGVSLTVPYFLEGKENFNDLDYWSYIKEHKAELGQALLGGAIVSPFLGIAKASIPVLSSPNRTGFQKMRESVLKSSRTGVEKAALLHEVDKHEAHAFGEDLEEIRKLYPDSGTDQYKHRDRVFRLLDSVDMLNNQLLEHKQKVKEGRAGQLTEVEQTVQELNKLVEDPDSNVDFRQVIWAGREAAKGKLAPEYEGLLSHDFVEEDYAELASAVNKIYEKKGPKWMQAHEGLERLFYPTDEGMPEAAQVKALEPILGRSFVKSYLGMIEKAKAKPKTFGSKVLSNAKEIFNFPRAMLASLDFSALGRQGALMFFVNNKAWRQGAKAGYRAFFDEDYADFIDLTIRTHPEYETLKSSGVFLSEVGSHERTEEYFVSKLAHKFPGVKASERAYVTTLNAMRAHAFYSIAEQWAGTGKSFDLPKLATVLNHITGRGDLGSLKKLAPALNMMFFAPKLQVARIQTLTDLIPKKDKNGRTFSPAQKLLAVSLAEAIGTGVLVLTLLSQLKGVEVEPNPESSDFGKIKIGDTRLDFWGGYSQIARLMCQLSLGTIKSTTTGEKYDINRTEVIARFLQSKLSPSAGIALDLYRGEDFKGDIIEPSLESGSKQLYQRFTPLFIQDTLDAMSNQGLNATSLATSALALHGVGAMTYPARESGKVGRLKNHYAQQMFNANWNELGPLAQDTVKQYHPLIGEQERRAKQERLNKAAKAKVLNEQRKSERKLRRALKPKVRQELDKLLVSVGGVGRTLSNDWYLNDVKYSQYQTETAATLNKVLPRLLELKITPDIKRVVLDDTIQKVKQQIRTKLVNRAKIEDLKYFREMNR